MALRFKKEYQNQTLALSSGALITADNVSSEFAQKQISDTPAYAYMFEEVEEATDAESKAPAAKTPAKKVQAKK